ncbi:Glutamine-dependent NAD(+) synthetase [Fundidesulfovibrio magnetotacticus]|uniref:Glutamine-dependent NAD(+) synthetase n=1 Tax=Fundidesulfovibrio magnetotacticus TaxID=2730080 RepID=A0A6V8LWN4_9BACT|nr:NAD+ synthase [Fundidesulfovibrio magnetotacticus]GFK94489.1 Glutamine-dependent NAD(+) synthetase [Fundidesulfovibrio magnetotacticus]
MKIGLLQVNPVVGDLTGNAGRIARAARKAQAAGAELCITPELALTGYPPRDLLLSSAFVDKARAVLEELARSLADGPALLAGTAARSPLAQGRPLMNCAAFLAGGRVEALLPKKLLPTYDVFDEDRYFEPGERLGFIDFAGRRLGVTICEDIWNDKAYWRDRRYHEDPVERLVAEGVQAILNLSASPFTLGKQPVREAMLGAAARKYGLPVVYCNQAGGNDDLVFDGRSMALDARGRLAARAAAFSEDVLVMDLEDLEQGRGEGRIAPDDFSEESEAWRALVLGVRDYCAKCGFKGALLGLSGGVDSALTAAVAAEALGPENVLGVLMPSPYSSRGSVEDSLDLARRLGVKTLTIPISDIMEAFERSLAPAFAGLPPDTTEENVQSRIRGNLLMAISNKHRSLLLTTGNKSELAVGYCTIYGDMSGGLAVVSDVPKTMVWRICEWLNARGPEPIPRAIVEKTPSAELRPDQTDQDSLPPYDVLDAILRLRVERHQSVEEIVAAGFDPETVRQVCRLVKIAEFKRRQAAPGIKITDRAFGTGWRMPVASRMEC